MFGARFSFKTQYAIWILAAAIAAIWICYFLVGQQLIDAVYHSRNSWLADRLMGGRDSNEVEAYYRQADAALAHGTLWVILTCAAIWLLLRKTAEILLFLFSCLATSFLTFYLLEKFPALIARTHLDSVLGYYAYKVNYMPDSQLVFREKPFNRRIIRNFTGTGYSPRYGIKVEPYNIEWIMDKDGFRNQQSADSADIVVLGDSYIEYGATEADTFVGRLEEKLPRFSARNLGKSGYSVGQYVQVLKRFGLRYSPKIALMAFYEGNDISGMRDYMAWKGGRWRDLHGYLFKFSTNSLWRRYVAAGSAMMVQARKAVEAIDEMSLGKLAMIRGYAPSIHREVANLNLHGRLYPKLFIDKLAEFTTDQMLATEELRALKKSFDEFRSVCKANGVIPMVVYIPTALQVYAPYSTQASGSQWLRLRDRQIAVRRNTERAINIVADRTGLEVISLTPAFEAAAAEGKMLYYALDAHWNAEGRETAARFVAEALKKRLLPKPRRKNDQKQH